MINKKILFSGSVLMFFTLVGCSQQPHIKKICDKGVYIPKYDVCQLTNKPIKGVVINIDKCNKNNCVYIIDDEVNNKIKITEKRGKYKVGDIVNIILYKKPKIVKIKD